MPSPGGPLPKDINLIYAKRSDESTLYAVDGKVIERLTRDAHGLRSKACMEFFTNSVAKAEVVQGDVSWTVVRAGESWVVAGAADKLDTKRVDDWLSSLADLRLAGFVDDNPERLKKYELDPPAATITVWIKDVDAPQRLYVGGQVEKTDNRYGRIDGREPVVRLPGFINELLKMGPEDFAVIVPADAPEIPVLPQ
jgi:hypothetical protein